MNVRRGNRSLNSILLPAACLAAALCTVPAPAQAAFVAYNDTAYNNTTGGPDSTGNVTNYRGDFITTTSGSTVFAGFDPAAPPGISGVLIDYYSGNSTGVIASMVANNVETGEGGMPNPGTPANDVFDLILGPSQQGVNLDTSASYGVNTLNWDYTVNFSNLDTTKTYEFVTTANRNNGPDDTEPGNYEGDENSVPKAVNSGDTSRWTQFSIAALSSFDASSYTSAGIRHIPGFVLLNSGYNTARGDIVKWTEIKPFPDGTFSVRSENVGASGPGEPFKSYGMQAFQLIEIDAEVPEPTSLLLLGGIGGLVVAGRCWRRKRQPAAA